MRHLSSRNRGVAHHIETEMPVYFHVFRRMRFEISLSSRFGTVFQHRFDKFPDQVFTLSVGPYDKVVEVPLATTSGVRSHLSTIVFVAHYSLH